MKIGALDIDNRTVLAPLAGITDLPFRLLAREAGCGLVCSEMVSAKGLVCRSKKTQRLLGSCPEEKPLSVQIFGADPFIMAEAATIVEASGASILDINFGCSVKKVVKTGAGAALMQSVKTAEAILTAVRKAVRIPMTIKMRSGWNGSGEQAVLIAAVAQDCGADAVTVHPRTATQGFSGKADWTIIAAVKDRLRIPVIGNGDIQSPRDAAAMRSETSCDAVMIGRAAIGAPWIFSQVQSFLQGQALTDPESVHRFDVMKRFLRLSVAYYGETVACRMMRSRLGWFAKGLRYSSVFRESTRHISNETEAARSIDAYRALLDRIQKS